MKKIISLMLAAVMTLTLFAGLNITAFASNTPENGWYKNESGEWFYFEDGDAVTNDWRQIKGKWYWFKDDGEMAANQHVHITNAKGTENVYVFDKNGAMMSNGWGKLVYTYSDGDTYTEWYYLRASGTAVTQAWRKLNNKWYWFDSCGEMACYDTRWITADGKDAYSDEEGAKLYLFDKNGAWVSTWGWAKLTYSWTDEDSIKHDDVDWFYVLKDGTVKTGWLRFHNEWYYLNEYWGNMYADGIYRIGGDELRGYIGEVDTTNYGKMYAFDKDGKMLHDRWYFAKADTAYISGDVLNKTHDVEGDHWYYLGSDGAAVTGWKRIKNVWYYFVPDYGYSFMHTGWLSLEDGVYYLDDNGAMVTGTQTIDGYEYEFDSHGRLIEDEPK